jgi:hypothetical protein
MAKIKCPKCPNEFEADLNFDSFYCEKCLTHIKPGFRMNHHDLIFLNGMFENSIIKPEAKDTFENTRKMFLKFAEEYKADRGFVKKTLKEASDELVKEYSRTNGDENYIQQIIDSRRAIANVLATLRA